MNDVQAEPGAALRTSGREERIESAALNFLRNTVAIIRESDLDLFRADATRLDQDVPAGPIGEAVSDGVEDKVGQYLPVRAREAVDDDIGRYLNCERRLRFHQTRPHTCGNLLGRQFQVEGAPGVTAAINCDLLERLNQASRALQVRDELFCCAATAVGELDEKGAPHLARSYLARKVGTAVR